jgi:hypothetical protein
MATSSFYNDNLFRTYPFVTSDEAIAFPKKRLASAKICCGYASPFRSFPRARLTDWTVRAAEHRLTFLVTADDIEISVPVTIPSSAPKFAHLFSDTVQEISVRLTVGDLMGETESFHELNLALEPTLVLWLRHRGVRSVRIGSESRDRLPSCLYEGISERQRKAYSEAKWWRQDSILTGPLLFSAGYNCRLVAASAENMLRFVPQAGAGLGETAEFVSLGTTLIDGRSIRELQENMPVRPDGLPHADRLLFSFCGAMGSEIEATATETIEVRNDIDASTVSIRVAALGAEGC